MVLCFLFVLLFILIILSYIYNELVENFNAYIINKMG
jgi:hypothetical protein